MLNSCQKTKFPLDRYALRNVYSHLATGPQTETQKHFPLSRSIRIASQSARTLCLFRLFVEFGLFCGVAIVSPYAQQPCVTFQPATLWDHVARKVACASNWAPAVRQFDTQQYMWHVGTQQLCINSQTAGISALRLYILLLFVVRVHVPAIL